MSETSHPMTRRHNPDGFNHLKLFIMIASYHMKQQLTDKQQTANIPSVWQMYHNRMQGKQLQII